ncbi:hypothetical protein ACJX0J_016139 [Zea mays]
MFLIFLKKGRIRWDILILWMVERYDRATVVTTTVFSVFVMLVVNIRNYFTIHKAYWTYATTKYGSTAILVFTTKGKIYSKNLGNKKWVTNISLAIQISKILKINIYTPMGMLHAGKKLQKRDL